VAIGLASREYEELNLSQILTDDQSDKYQVLLLTELTYIDLKCLLDVTNSGSEFNEMVAQDISTLCFQDKYTRYCNTYFVSYTDLFSVRLDIKEVSSQVKMINNGGTTLIITKDEDSFSEIFQEVIQKMFKLTKSNQKKTFF
jgi:hypothetical protein